MFYNDDDAFNNLYTIVYIFNILNFRDICFEMFPLKNMITLLIFRLLYLNIIKNAIKNIK